MNINGKRVLITGGSSGIGLAIAHALLAKGAKLVITGRRADTLAKAVQELQHIDSPIYEGSFGALKKHECRHELSSFNRR
jgi:NAD(P)-dependent dehydrogenase (short-subunit alcohol dehydrogenase family)